MGCSELVARRLPVLVMPRERICIGLMGRVSGDSRSNEAGCAMWRILCCLLSRPLGGQAHGDRIGRYIGVVAFFRQGTRSHYVPLIMILTSLAISTSSCRISRIHCLGDGGMDDGR